MRDSIRYGLILLLVGFWAHEKLLAQVTFSNLYQTNLSSASFASFVVDQDRILISGPSFCQGLIRCNSLTLLEDTGGFLAQDSFRFRDARGVEPAIWYDEAVWIVGQDVMGDIPQLTVSKYGLDSIRFSEQASRNFEYSDVEQIGWDIAIKRDETVLVISSYVESQSPYRLIQLDTTLDAILLDILFVADSGFFNFNIQNIEPTSDNGFLMKGSSSTTSNSRNVFFFRKYDASFHLEWERKYFTSDFVFATSYYDGLVVDSADFFYAALEFGSQPFVYKFDPEGNELWSTEIRTADPDLPGGWKYIRDFYIAANGDILGCGNDFLPDPDVTRGGWIFRLSPDGEQLWERRYTHFSLAQDTADRSSESGVFRSILELDDGSIIATGANNDTVTLNGEMARTEHIWVVRLDSNGCLFPDCELTDDQLYTGLFDLQDDLSRTDFVLYPNPAANYVNIEWNQNCSDCQVQLYELDGRLIRSDAVRPEVVSYSMDVSSMRSGAYFCTIRGSDFLGRVKMVVIE